MQFYVRFIIELMGKLKNATKPINFVYADAKWVISLIYSLVLGVCA